MDLGEEKVLVEASEDDDNFTTKCNGEGAFIDTNKGNKEVKVYESTCINSLVSGKKEIGCRNLGQDVPLLRDNKECSSIQTEATTDPQGSMDAREHTAVDIPTLSNVDRRRHLKDRAEEINNTAATMPDTDGQDDRGQSSGNGEGIRTALMGSHQSIATMPNSDHETYRRNRPGITTGTISATNSQYGLALNIPTIGNAESNVLTSFKEEQKRRDVVRTSCIGPEVFVAPNNEVHSTNDAMGKGNGNGEEISTALIDSHEEDAFNISTVSTTALRDSMAMGDRMEGGRSCNATIPRNDQDPYGRNGDTQIDVYIEENINVPANSHSNEEGNNIGSTPTAEDDAEVYDGNEDDITIGTIDYSDSRDSTLLINTNENDVGQNEQVRRSSIMKRFNDVVKVIYVVLFLPRLFSLIVYLGYDVKCAINEETTFANCTQEFLVRSPKNYVLYSKAISTISSLVLLFILWCSGEELNYSFYRPIKKLKCKAKFWSTNVLFAATFAYYIIRIDGSDIQLSIALLTWWPATLLVVYCLNYLRPVVLPDRNERSRLSLCFFLGYWSTILVYCAETFCVFVAVSLAAKKNIIPVVNRVEDYKVKAFAVLVATFIRVAFASILWSFFWYRMFHGRKDFFP